jgi:hypothetical protein
LSVDELLRALDPSEARERADAFEEWLSELADPAVTAASSLVELAEVIGCPSSGPESVRTAATELLAGPRENWACLGSVEAFGAELARRIAKRAERRDATREALVGLVDGLGDEALRRLGLRLSTHLEEVDLPVVDPGDLLDRTLEAIRVGPAVAGGWDCGADDTQRVGFVLLLAERIARGLPVEEIVWAFERVLGRYGARIGPLAFDDTARAVTSRVRGGMTLFVGPPASGKTTTMESTLLSWPGPLISTTTKPADWSVGLVTALLEKGPVYLFDATGEATLPHPDVQPVCWSPLQVVKDWDSARRAAHTINSTVSKADLNDGQFWATAAYQLISVHLYAAMRIGETMATVASWVDTQEFDEVAGALRNAHALPALNALVHTAQLADMTRGSIYATAAAALDPFRSDAVRSVTDFPTFDIDRDLIEDNASVIMYADGMRANHTAALYSLFIDAAVQARKARSDKFWVGPHLLLALDEVANITPLPTLPGLLTEGPGRGITGIFCLQDLTQATAKWGDDGELFLTSTGHRLVFPGTTSQDLHAWVTNLIEPTTRSRRIAGFARDLDAATPTTTRDLTGTAAIASPGTGRVVIIAPDATVRTASQARSFEQPDYRDAQHQARTLRDPRNALILGTDPDRLGGA